MRALGSAQEFVYLENQFLWSTEIVDVLVNKLRRPPSADFRIVLVLPTRPSSGADTTRGQLGRLLEADDGQRLLPATVRSHEAGTHGPIYVHAKVGIVDDRWLTIGSANLNEHSLFNDTEVNVLSQDRELARKTRLQLWSEHLERPVDELDGPPAVVIDRYWKPLVGDTDPREPAPAVEPGPTTRVVRLPAISRRAERLLGPMRGLLVDG